MSEHKNDALFAHTHPDFAADMDFSIYPEAEADPRIVSYPKDHPKYVEIGVRAVESSSTPQASAELSSQESDNQEYVPANRP